MLNTRVFHSVVVAAALALSGHAFAQERANQAEAEAMVAKGVAAVQADSAKAYADITAPSKTYVDRDLYLVVYDLNGKCLAHGQNPKQVGKELIKLRDPDGKLFVKERVDLANEKGSFWQDYKFTDPLTKTVKAKKMFCQKASDVVVCGGVYPS